MFLELRTNYIGHDVIAVDLALQRAAPLEIGEYYGKYNVVVEQTLEDAQNLVLYRNEQVFFAFALCDLKNLLTLQGFVVRFCVF